MSLPTAPFEANRYLGSVTQIEPASVRLNLPHGYATASSSYSGHYVGRGEVGEFVLIEGETHAILGRLTQVRLPEGERLAVEPSRESGKMPVNPVGVVQLLLSIDLSSGNIIRGVPEHPRIGQYAYAAHPDLVKHAVEDSRGRQQHQVDLAHVPSSRTTLVSFAPSALFGRHCAVLGTTGGGKSWTVARMLGEIARHGGKAILFDPSGEFHTLNQRVRHVHLGGKPVHDNDQGKFVSFPYRHLSESDLFAMFQPSGGSQSPKLREALTSLKLLALDPSLANQDGLLRKANAPKTRFNLALRQHAAAIREPGADYDITQLPRQIYEECVWPTGPGGNASNWGSYDQNSQGYCTTLISRVAVQIGSREMACIFAPAGARDLTEVLDEFLANDQESILRISMEDLPFEHNTRELVANGFGRYLLTRARAGVFRQRPVLAVLDEAHQFLNKSVGDDYNRFRLESFGLIAKEGRKYGLLTVLSTQRPRDIPEDVLSQMGMFIVHRLINEKDRQIVERACGSLDASAAAFLPILGQGEALVIGLDTAMTMPVQVLRPDAEPDSTDIALW
ncbi:ATP-binding protein [Algihabitans albus]|uniref:ATP-binding protein n=1 Tax=Algihabitans albus TaxID=2164067 RepID=UPI0035D0EDDC